MGITLPETSDNHIQWSISLGLDPLFLEFSPNFDQIHSINRVEINLIEDFQMNLGDESSLDQDTGLAALLDSPEIPVIEAPYKQMPNFDSSTIGYSRPVLTIPDNMMDLNKARASQPDSPYRIVNPGSAATSPKGSLKPDEQAPVAPVEPDPKPVEVQRPAGEERVILDGGEVAMNEEDQGWMPLGLPRVLTNCQDWVTADTLCKIDRACGEAGNLKCRQYGGNSPLPGD